MRKTPTLFLAVVKPNEWARGRTGGTEIAEQKGNDFFGADVATK